MTEKSDEVRALFTPGNKVRLRLNIGNPNNCLMHALAIVDDDYAVFKTWGRRKKRWLYRVEFMYLFELYHKRGVLYRA